MDVLVNILRWFFARRVIIHGRRLISLRVSCAHIRNFLPHFQCGMRTPFRVRSAFFELFPEFRFLRRFLLSLRTCAKRISLPYDTMTNHLHDFNLTYIDIQKWGFWSTCVGAKPEVVYRSCLLCRFTQNKSAETVENKDLIFPENAEYFITNSRLLRIRWMRVTDAIVRVTLIFENLYCPYYMTLSHRSSHTKRYSSPG